MKSLLLFSIACLGLAGCSYVSENVQVSYQPMIQSNSKVPIADTNVTVMVVDNRRDGKQVGRKKGDYGIELASIKLKGDLANEVAAAVQTELQNLGCNIKEGNLGVEIEIQKFYNEFKPGFMGGRGIAELILGVSVKKSDGHIVYSKTIIGLGENDSVWAHSGKNAKVALDGAFNDAVHKLISDQAFLQTLRK